MSTFDQTWQPIFLQLKKRSKERAVRPIISVHDFFQTLESEWQQALQKMNQLFEQDQSQSIWSKQLCIWSLSIEFMDEIVQVYELSREKVQFADQFGMYYRTVAMIEANQMIHSNRWVNQFVQFQAPLEAIPSENDEQIEALLLRLMKIWKSHVPEQLWFTAWILDQLQQWKPLKKWIQTHFRMDEHKWFKEWLLGHDVMCKKILGQISPLLRIRAICLVLFFFSRTSTDPNRYLNWLRFALESLQYASPQEADVIWTYWENFLIDCSDEMAEKQFVQGLVDHLPVTKERLFGFFKANQRWSQIIEMELITNGDPQTWSPNVFNEWIDLRPELLLPWLHQRVDFVRKLRPLERDAELPFLLQTLQQIYVKIDRIADWEKYWTWFFEQHGRIREVKTLFDKDVSR